MASPPAPLVARSAVRDADSLPSDRGIDRVLDARDDQTAEQDKVLDAEGSRRNPIFILDSGASYHVTSDKWLFHRLDVAAATESRPTTVRRPDGTSLPVAGTGTIASENFHLRDVLYIPGLMPGKIIVSVSKLADLGCSVMFGGSQCRVMDKTDKLVGQGPLHRDDDGFYYRLEFLKIPTLLDEAAADGTELLKIPLEEAAAADETDSKVV